MRDDQPVIGAVTDTARWVAYYRGVESARPDALFQDPYAWRLAGDAGRDIAERMGNGRAISRSIAVRTQVIDEVVMDTIVTQGIDLVVNLAAGLDSRPYRLALPETLTWVEADLPVIIDYKSGVLASDKPRCRLERIAIDLSDRQARQDLFRRLEGMGQRILVLTEGLLVYLPETAVGELADDLRAMQHVVVWVSDVITAAVVSRMRQSWQRRGVSDQVRLQFAPEDPSSFFAGHRWRTQVFRANFDEGRRLQRPFPGSGLMRFFMWFVNEAARERMRRISGIIVLEPA